MWVYVTVLRVNFLMIFLSGERFLPWNVRQHVCATPAFDPLRHADARAQPNDFARLLDCIRFVWPVDP